jgi:hypothetical protein
VQAVRDEGVFQLQQRGAQRVQARAVLPGGFGRGEFDRRRLRLEDGEHRQRLAALRLQGAPAVEAALEVEQAAIQSGMGHGRRQVADEGGIGPALGQHALGRVVGGIQVEVRQVADQAVGPAGGGHAGLLAGHEFQRAMGAEMQHGVGLEILAQPAIEGAEGVGGGEAVLEEQAHRVALVAEAGLHADEDVAEALAEDVDGAAVGLVTARRRAPLLFDLGEVGLAADVVVHAHPRADIGERAEALGIAVQDAGAQRVLVGRQVHRVALGLHGAQRGEDGAEHGQVGGGARVAGIGREVEDDEADASLGAGLAAQRHQLRHAGGEHPGALGMDDHAAPADDDDAVAAGAGNGGRAATPAEGHRQGRAVQLRDGDHHGGLDRGEAALVLFPVGESLEFERVGGDIGNVEAGQHLLGGAAVVIGRPADQREAGERYHGVHIRRTIGHEEALDGGPLVEARGEGRNDRQAARFEGRDHAVVMRRIPAEHVGAHDEDADAPGRARKRGQRRQGAGTQPGMRG